MFMGTTKVVITHSDFQPKRRGRGYSISGRELDANQWGLSLSGKCYI